MLQILDHFKLSCTAKRSGKRLYVTVHVNDLRTGEVQIQILEFALSQIGRMSNKEIRSLNSAKEGEIGFDPSIKTEDSEEQEEVTEEQPVEVEDEEVVEDALEEDVK